MKRFYAYLVAAFALTAVSCSNDLTEEVTPAEPVQTGTVEMTFSATLDETRTLLDYENRQTLWSDDDTISILDDQGGNNEFTIKEHDGVSAIFSGKVNEGATKFVAVYPYNAKYTWDGTTISGIEIPATQACVAGTFPEESNITVAVADENYSLAFKNVCSILKFTVPSFAQAITKVTISANNALAGGVDVTAEGEAPAHELVSGNQTVTLTGNFEAGKSYFCAVIPGEQNNLEVRFNGYLSKSATGKSLNFKRSVIMDLKALPAPVECEWGLVGQHQNWQLNKNALTRLYKEGDKLFVVKNIKLSNTGFKFTKLTNTNWDLTFGSHSSSYVYKESDGWYTGIYSNNRGDKANDIKVSNWNITYDIYLRYVQDADWGQELGFCIVQAGKAYPTF
uniref:hypothetical protein n=1 Tax=Alistipes sp. TaxID=1872444 RepID=UPI00405729CF